MASSALGSALRTASGATVARIHLGSHSQPIIMAYYDTYRDQLASLYHGHALWMPDPAGLYDRVRVGDIGYVKQGHFLRMFNALLPANDRTQVYGVPEGFVPLNMGPFNNIRTLNLFQGDYCSNTVTVDHEDRRQAAGPDEGTRASFKCSRRNKGAFLSLPFNGDSVDAIRTKAFETYIRKHCDSWLEFAIINELDVRLEDIILVTGCDLTASWAMAAFANMLDPEIRLSIQASEAGIARFQWTVTNQPHHNEPNQNVVKSHCVFLRGFRAKRILPFYKTLKAAAGPRPDDPDNEPESTIELLREPAIPDYRDPLVGILDYIADQRPNEEIAIAHEDDLKMIEGVDVLTADAVESFMRRNGIPVQTEKGVALLADDSEDEDIPEEAKLTFHARADVGGEQIRLVIHPVLMKYLLEFDIASQPVDYDFGLPTEELLSSAVFPPVRLLVLENEQGLPQIIEVSASNSELGSGSGVTVGGVLWTIRLNLRRSQRKWAMLNDYTPKEVQDAFEDGVRTEEKSGGFRRIDSLRGRNRLQIFPKHPLPEDDDGIPQLLPYNLTSDEEDKSKRPTSKRRALLVGISYKNHNKGPVLDGPHENINCFLQLLTYTYGYRPEDIVVLEDDPSLPYHLQPTRDNMIRELERLVVGAAPGDTLVFFYSGLSDLQSTSDDIEEDDIQDERIISCDQQYILDDELNYILFPLPVGCTLLTILDTSHSNNLLGLPHYYCNSVYVPWQSHRTLTIQNDNARHHATDFTKPKSPNPSDRPARPRVRFDDEPSEGRPADQRDSSSAAQSRKARRPREPPLFPSQPRSDSLFVCDGWCDRDDDPYPTVLALSACSNLRAAWEGPNGSLTRIMCNYLKSHSRPSYRALMSHINFQLYDNDFELHKHTRYQTKKATGSEGDGFDGEHTLYTFQDPMLRSLAKLDMDEILKF